MAGAQVVDQVAGTQAVDHCWCALHVDATYLKSTYLGSARLHIRHMPSTTATAATSYDNHPLNQKLDPRLEYILLQQVPSAKYHWHINVLISS